jgi:uncharacterized protein (TIGR03067 family)
MLVALFSCATAKKINNNPLLGQWDNKAGQILEFKQDNKAYWIFYTDTKRDTFEIAYKTNLSGQPKQIDLTDFKVGPLVGKTLYGILEFTDKNTMRLDFEPKEENRPKDFDKDQTQTYFKIRDAKS